MVGSLGTLGVLTQATLMVRPMPDTAAIMACDVGDDAQADRLLAALARTETLPVAIDWLSGPVWADDPALGPITAGAAGRLLVGFEGAASEVDWMLETLAGAWNQCGAAHPVTVAGAQVEPLYARLTEFPIQPDGDAALVVRYAVLPSATIATARRLREIDPSVSIEAHAGSGIVQARCAVPAEAAASLVGDRLRPVAQEAGGAMVVLAAPDGADLDAECVWGPPCNGAAVMQAIKDRFDPKGILNPGRFIFH